MKPVEFTYNAPTATLRSKTASVDIDQIEKFLRTTSSIPTWIPKNFYEQVAIYYTGGVATRLYIYDPTNKAWHYATLT